jgi:hypothetical protein
MKADHGHPAAKISRRTFLAAGTTLAVTRGATRVFAGSDQPSDLPSRVKNVNTTDIRAAVEMGCQTMSSVFNLDDTDVPFFASEVWPKAELSFFKFHSEAHVPGRHLNALLNAEDAFGIRLDESVIEKHARAAFLSYSGAIPLPLNRETIGGKLILFHPHNIREGFHALYALVKYQKSERARELAEASIAAITKYWNPDTGWDRKYLESHFGLVVVDTSLITGVGRAIGPLVKYYRATQYRPALELARVLKDKAIAEFFTPSGEFSAALFGSHVHSTTCVMSSLAQFADLTKDTGLMSRVQKFFDNGLKRISDDLGWSPDSTDDPVTDRGEVNNTGDIVETALLLGASLDRSYYQRAERILRGHLLPCQLRDVSWITNPPNPTGEDGKRDIAQRHLGAFGFPAPYGHQPVGARSIGFNMDVVGGAVGSLCEVWRMATTFDDTGHRVNLLFDRETEAISVKSAYPHGTLRLEVRKAGPLLVRIPDWISQRDTTVEGAGSDPRFGTNSLLIARPPVGKPIAIGIPLRTSEIELNHYAHRIRVRLRGDSVVAMENFGMPLTWFDAL